MSNDMALTWVGDDEVLQNMDSYADKVRWAVRQVAEYWRLQWESEAKENASWEDQTGNARQALYAEIEDLADDAVKLYLSHGVDYGLWLEIRWAGKYAIIWPTIEASLTAIRRMLQGIFS
jgi:hypothetical protein